MHKAKDDYEGMIIAAINATKSDDVNAIIKYIQGNFTVPTNFEKHVKQRWMQVRKKKIDTLYDGSPPKPTKMTRRLSESGSRRPPPLSLSVVYLPNEILHQIFKYLVPQDLYKFRRVCTQWRDVAMDKGLRRVVRLSNLTFLSLSLLRTILQSASILQVLDLSGSPVTDHMTSVLAQKPPGNLKRLHTLDISRCTLLNPTGAYNLFSAFASATPSLTSLNVAECKLDDSVVNTFISKFTNLTFLDISRIWTISTGAIYNLTQSCTKLQKINMINLTFICDPAIVSLAENCKNLSHVDMSCCFGLTSDTLAHLTEHPLQYLSMQSISVSSAFALPPTLRHLDMSKCVGMTDAYLSPIVLACTRLETLSLASCPDLSDSSLDLLSTHLSTSLTSLNISGCLGLTPQGIETSLPSFTRLTDLQLAHLNLSDSFFSDHISSFPHLKSLDISHNTRITDAGILAITHACKWLQALACDALRSSAPSGLRAVPASPASKKKGVTAESLTHLGQCAYLRSLSLVGTLGFEVHSTHYVSLVRACGYLEHLAFGDCSLSSPSPFSPSATNELRLRLERLNPSLKVVCK
eukprot:Phypoly_transcript_05963.p1 GENE.Phypoly_transcript_05963~~Phypoly_transcript_05963.p1  ORF type:complete len:579 (+),score=96.05 Phypoly_transcript_05963:127-1863(+)